MVELKMFVSVSCFTVLCVRLVVLRYHGLDIFHKRPRP